MRGFRRSLFLANSNLTAMGVDLDKLLLGLGVSATLFFRVIESLLSGVDPSGE